MSGNRGAADGQGKKVISGADRVLLTPTAAAVGMDRGLSAALSPWRRPLARQDPGKMLLDLVMSLVAQLRAHLQAFGPVASDPTVSQPRALYVRVITSKREEPPT